MKKYIMLLVVISTLIGTEVLAGNIAGTKHNLSVSGLGPIKSSTAKEICIFCHAPPGPRITADFLWNRENTTKYYIPYQSSSLYATVGQPTGASKLCLSCHDGTIALGALTSMPKEILFMGGIRFMPPGTSRLGTDLSDDHPISFMYDWDLFVSNRELVDPGQLPKKIKLDRDKQLQCTACHDPHDDTHGNFLVMSNQYSALCTSCHKKAGWGESSHALSNAGWNGQAPNPWANTEFTNVAENGCENCHRPHSGEGEQRLLKYAFEEDNCLICHNGNVAATNIADDISKPYRHAVQDYVNVHDVAEDFTSGEVSKHVECQDCHDPHQINKQKAMVPGNSDKYTGPPVVSGPNKGVTGINIGGQQISEAIYLFEICYKCHADNNVLTEHTITRDIDQLNTRLEFDPHNPSYHPIVEEGVNENVPSLLQPYTVESIISCTNCHNSGSPEGPKGPHGSKYRYLLVKNYTTEDLTPENTDSYALCYKCHSRNSILGNESFPKHSMHIVDQQTPCAICHDPHGISNTQGNSGNNSHLINFDLTVVLQNSQGNLYFEDLGTFEGRCSLICHGETHELKTYP